MKMNQDKISDIEKMVTELKFLERDLIKEREIGRIKSLDNAEKSLIVENAIKKIFLSYIGAERKDIIVNSYSSKFTGRDDEEFLSEVKVEIRFRPAVSSAEFNELTLSVYLNDGFQDSDVQKLEKDIMDRLVKIRKDVDELKESKKSLKLNI